jgi:hypothetical protein
MKMKVACSSETLVAAYMIRGVRNGLDHKLNNHSRENIGSFIICGYIFVIYSI